MKKNYSIFSLFTLKMLCLGFGLVAGCLMYLMNEYPNHESGMLFWLGAIVAMVFSF